MAISGDCIVSTWGSYLQDTQLSQFQAVGTIQSLAVGALVSTSTRHDLIQFCRVLDSFGVAGWLNHLIINQSYLG